MSDFTQALLVGGGIAGFVIATQYGRHTVEGHSVMRSLLVVAGFGCFYAIGAPTGHSALVAYAVAAAIGLVFAAVATATTAMVRDRLTGRATTICGVGFVVTWLVAFAARLVFVALADYNSAFGAHLASFLYHHHLSQDAIAPFFVIWALTMVVGRVVANLVRASRLPQLDTDVAGAQLEQPA